MGSHKNEEFGKYFFRGYRKKIQKFSAKLRNSKFSFKIALVLRKIVLRSKVEIVDVHSIGGLKMRLYPLDNIGDRLALFMPWFFEAKEFELMKKILKNGDSFVDVGANSGYYTLLASRIVGDSGSVFSLEPNPIMYERLLFNIEHNDANNIETINLGLANKSGIYKLSVNPTNLGNASILDLKSVKESYSIDVKCKSLLEVLNEHGISKIDFLKIDIEEAEPLVLNPFFESASQSLWPRHILTESIGNIPFKELGYKETYNTKNNTFFKLAN